MKLSICIVVYFCTEKISVALLVLVLGRAYEVEYIVNFFELEAPLFEEYIVLRIAPKKDSYTCIIRDQFYFDTTKIVTINLGSF